MSSYDNNILYYVHDPMCSWCWGFRPVWQQVKKNLQDTVQIEYLLGGLAADSQDPMPEALQSKLQQTWRTIAEKIPNTNFNFDFWSQCQPRRSTYPACRAVLLAKQADASLEESMIYAIQRAYYLQAKNPSDDSTLVELAQSLGLDGEQFREQLAAPETMQSLQREIQYAHSIGGNSFPSLILQRNEDTILIPHHYTDAEETLRRIRQYLQ